MNELKIVVDDKEVKQALRKAPEVMQRHLSRGVRRGAAELVREERRLAPKAFSTLTNSIRAIALGPLVSQVAPGVEYAEYVEDGTRRGGGPGARTMIDWIRTKGISPRNPDMTQEDLAHVLARMIPLKGTPAQPFAEPALQAKESRVTQLIRDAATAGMREAGLV